MNLQKLWFYSDPHFFHHNIIRYANRPYQNVEDMNQDLILKLNSKVGKNDKVIFVGDMFFFKRNKEDIQKCLDIFHALNGNHKTLIIENHDKSSFFLPYDMSVKSLTINIQNEEVLINHYPYRPTDRPEMTRRPLDEGKFLVHGHSHNKVKVKNKMINVCCDSWDYFPISLEEISEIIESIKSN
jgi:calcineurin-like phosphoesterase family protein